MIIDLFLAEQINKTIWKTMIIIKKSAIIFCFTINKYYYFELNILLASFI